MQVASRPKSGAVGLFHCVWLVTASKFSVFLVCLFPSLLAGEQTSLQTFFVYSHRYFWVVTFETQRKPKGLTTVLSIGSESTHLGCLCLSTFQDLMSVSCTERPEGLAICTYRRNGEKHVYFILVMNLEHRFSVLMFTFGK